MRVYLCGPITGRSETSITSWRQTAARNLADVAEVIDPALYPYDSKSAFQISEKPSRAIKRLRHGLHVVHRNKALIRGSDVLLANFLGSGASPSIGSVGEIYWADAYGKLILIAREPHGNVHDHAMLNAIAANIYESLEKALAAIRELAGTPQLQTQTA